MEKDSKRSKKSSATKINKAKADAIRKIEDIAGDLLHYSVPRDYAERIYDNLREACVDPADMDLDAINTAIDELKLKRAPDEDEDDDDDDDDDSEGVS